MKERVLAVVAAVALVAVAVVARSFLADDDGGGGGRGGGARPVVACTADLMAICEALAEDGRIADDPPTLDLGGDRMTDREIEGWITWDPAPALVNFDDPESWTTTQALAQGSLGVLMRSSAVSELSTSCSGPVSWDCLARLEAVPSLGVGLPSTSEGLTRLAPLAKALDPENLNDIDTQTIRAILESPQGQQQAFGTQADLLITQGPGLVGAVVGPEAALDAKTQTAQGGNTTVIAPTPSARSTVVVSFRSQTNVDAEGWLSSTRVSAAFRSLGLTVDPSAALAGEDLAGFLYQVREQAG